MPLETCDYLNLSKIAHTYNSGKMKNIGFCRFHLNADSSNSYPTSKCALIFPISGKAQFQFDNQIYTINRGKLLHGCPNKFLTIRTFEKEDFTYINMYYDADNEFTFSLNLMHTDEIFKLLNHIVDLNNSTLFKDQFSISTLTSQLMELLFKEVQPSSISSESEILNELLEYIHFHYSEPITLTLLADYIGEKPARITYLFKKHLNVCPIDYLIDYRIKEATDLIKATSCTIEAAANSVGYSDPLYFSRIFKKRMGFPPSQLKTF